MDNYEKYQDESVDKVVGFIDSYGRCVVGCQYSDPKCIQNKILSKYKDDEDTTNYFIITKEFTEYPQIPAGINVTLASYNTVKNLAINPNRSFINTYNNNHTVFIFCDIDIITVYNAGWLNMFIDFICPNARHAFIANYKRELIYKIAPVGRCKLQIV